MFESLQMAPADPILGLGEAFQKDPNPAKINLSVGVYQDEQGNTPVLETVNRAQQRLLADETTKSYLPITGLATFNSHVQRLIFGPAHPCLAAQRVATLQSPGGTGALRVAADFIHQHYPRASVWVSQPTWANHPQIFQAAGLPVRQYDYLDRACRGLDFGALLPALQEIPAGDVVLLHACCHNPSGVDPTPEQWEQIAEVLSARRLLPLIDFAYQGFGTGLDADATGLRIVAQRVPELLVASSYSKNFGLYRDRVGALSVVASDRQQAEIVMSQLKRCVRTNYSNPPAYGGMIVAAILGDESLRASWIQEVDAMRARIAGMRELFVRTMGELAPQHDFGFLLNQNGMFSFSGLSPEQVDQLREQYAIYIVRSGRINVAGMTPGNVQPLCRAVATVLG